MCMFASCCSLSEHVQQLWLPHNNVLTVDMCAVTILEQIGFPSFSGQLSKILTPSWTKI